MRVLVTGAAGFIGSTLVDRLLAEGHSVDVVDDLSSGSLANLAEARSNPDNDYSFHRLDIRSDAVVELIAHRQPEVVFHLAAQADVRVSVQDPGLDADVNVRGTVEVLEAARAFEDNPNVLFETSVVNARDLYVLFCSVDAGRICYGSDIPYGDIPSTLHAALAAAEAAGMPEHKIPAIVSGNIRRWFP